MAGGNAIRGTRVGAGPMGESERGETAPRARVASAPVTSTSSNSSSTTTIPVPTANSAGTSSSKIGSS